MIESLTQEIGRISTDTEFNTKKLLDGSLDQRVYVNSRSVQRVDISDSVSAALYGMKVTQDARQAVLVGSATAATGDIPAGVISINGAEVEIKEGQDLYSVFESLRDVAERGEVNLFAVDTPNNTGGKVENAGYEPAAFEPGKQLVFVSDR